MAMTIGGSNPYVSTYNRSSGAAQSTMQKIATGLNYPNASYGASEYAATVSLTSNIGATSQSYQNTQNMSSMLKVAQGAIDNTINGLMTIQKHLVNAANDSNTDEDRQAIQKEIDQLISQIGSNAYVEYNGKRLLDGSQNSFMVAGVDGYQELKASDIRTEALGLTDEEGNVTISALTPEGARTSLEIVTGALKYVEEINGDMYVALKGGYSLDKILDAATTQGAQLQRLEFQAANYATMEENQQAALSNIGDADIAKMVIDLRNEQNMKKLALFAIKAFNHNRASIANALQ